MSAGARSHAAGVAGRLGVGPWAHTRLTRTAMRLSTRERRYQTAVKTTFFEDKTPLFSLNDQMENVMPWCNNQIAVVFPVRQSSRARAAVSCGALGGRRECREEPTRVALTDL